MLRVLMFAILRPMKNIFGQPWLLIPALLIMTALLWALGLPFFRWLRLLFPLPAWLFALIWLAPALSLTLSYLLSDRRLRSWLHRVGECWFGLFLYLTMSFLLAAAVLRLIQISGAKVSDLWRIRAGWLALAAFALCYIGGVINALHVRVKRVTIHLPIRRSLRLVLMSDLHLGFFSGPHMLPRIVKAIAEQEPDAVLLAGDIFDMGYEDLRRPELHRQALAGLSCHTPVFACGGNHDLLFPDLRKDAFIRGCGIRLLEDESVSWQGLTILGRRDAMDERRLPPQQVYPGLSKDRPLLVLDHNPRTYREAWEQGAELVVSGHSHGGQTFPGYLLQRALMPYPIYGHRQEGGRHLVVTSGAGFWGPPLRVGVNNEVVLLQLEPVLQKPVERE